MLHPTNTYRTTRAIKHALKQSNKNNRVHYFINRDGDLDRSLEYFIYEIDIIQDKSLLEIFVDDKEVFLHLSDFYDLDMVKDVFNLKDIVFVDHNIIETCVESVYNDMISTVINGVRELDQEYIVNQLTIELNNRLLRYIWGKDNFYMLVSYINHMKTRIDYLVEKSKEYTFF